MSTRAKKESKSAQPQVNPIVQAAADQVNKTKRRNSNALAKERLRRWECRDQLSLFDLPEVTE
ncbi:hypothetical protein [Nocardia pseudobrasiliensis]|uniref:Uncharacterized protein n=1 Tax=Nocardia pseudobrasiliensis TaxID=45979 RepID=A0A370I3Z5_9NOCA|nr:hypothetical protein [Nocardia pseudobrasiliensis]RDI64044.1 hypothetical protein DFR76_109385 [Nocardia pseudobrasiliensis]